MRFSHHSRLGSQLTDIIAANNALIGHLQHAYSSEGNLSDGEIFRKILLSKEEGDLTEEHFWWSRLSKTKTRTLNQLLKNELYQVAFGNLVCMPGLWPGLELGALHRFLTLKCDEVNISRTVVRGLDLQNTGNPSLP